MDSSGESDPVPVFPMDEDDSEALHYLLSVRSEEERLGVSAKSQPQQSEWELPPTTPITLLTLPVQEDKVTAILQHFQTLRDTLEAQSTYDPVDYIKGSKEQWWTYFDDVNNQPWTDYTLRFSHTLTLKLVTAMAKWASAGSLPRGYELWTFALLSRLHTPLLADTEASLTCLGKLVARDLHKETHLLLLVVIVHYFKLKLWLE